MSRFDCILSAFEEADYLVTTTRQPYAIVAIDNTWVSVVPLTEARKGPHRILETVYGHS